MSLIYKKRSKLLQNLLRKNKCANYQSSIALYARRQLNDSFPQKTTVLFGLVHISLLCLANIRSRIYSVKELILLGCNSKMLFKLMYEVA